MLKKIILIITILCFPLLYGFQKISNNLIRKDKIASIKKHLKDYHITVLNNLKQYKINENRENLFILDEANEIPPYNGQLLKRDDILFEAINKNTKNSTNNNITLRKIKPTETVIYNSKEYLEKYYTGNFDLVNTWEIKESKLSSDNIEEIGINNPTEEQLTSICDDIFGHGDREYPGCGPNALLGIIDHFAKNMGFFNFYNNNLIMQDRKKMAREVIKNTPTKKWNPNSIQTTSSQYVKGFQKLVDKFNYEDFLTYKRGNIFQDREKMILDSLCEGFPVSIWTFETCYPYPNHWFNIYGYEVWKDSNNKEYIMYKIRPNWNEKDDCFADASQLKGIWGAVYFSFKKNNIRNFSSKDFNLGKFYNKYEIKNRYISNKQGDLLQISYLNTGYIKPYYEDKIRFLTMNAGKNNQETYFKIKPSFKLNKVRLSYSLWSQFEKLGNYKNDYVKIYNNSTYNKYTYNISLSSISKERAKWSYIEIDLTNTNATHFLIEVFLSILTNDNCGRFVFDNLIFYD